MIVVGGDDLEAMLGDKSLTRCLHKASVNVRRIASGPVDEVFTEEKLREAYGGRVPFRSQEAAHEH